ncbi:hypothetical protein N7462_008842 [Penicillium macrosclerotiorum]|uniref:uncharacterized protein n=1 Tax=Penicillium macrosclerotiorum TaxID=303699 RepID=UPI00254990FD|nr:uncharacterized protein N7462_008842 [Penicillium macrosclerotiorum]KAJ5675945.1 hypothetical protein N7462_008842 [Penicillium macrosclerotiorum]
MKVGIVNAGNVGLRLGIAWIRLGHDAVLSKDTHAEQLRERVRELSLKKGIGEDETARFK